MKEENDEVINNNEILDEKEINEEEKNTEEITREEELEEQIEVYEEIQEGDRRQKVILVIIIIILLFLLLFWLVGVRLGKIGYSNEVFFTQNGNNENYYFNYDYNNSPNNNFNIKLIEVRDEDVDIIKNTEIDIFENEKFNWQNIIAPRSSGTYEFCVKNISNRDITYDINFTDEMDLPVNMKYKLKIDNIYIRGNEDSYINIDGLNVKDIIVVKDSINLFTLEWYWEDDDGNDTIVGSQKEDQHYILNLEIRAEDYNKQR